jgi:hypothetical protein
MLGLMARLYASRRRLNSAPIKYCRLVHSTLACARTTLLRTPFAHVMGTGCVYGQVFRTTQSLITKQRHVRGTFHGPS